MATGIEIGRRIQQLRKDRGLSQEAVARRTQIGLRAYGELERGHTIDPHYLTLVGIAEALGVSVAELVGEEPAVPKASAPPSEATTGPATAGETIVYLSGEPGEGDPPALHTAGELLSYFLAEGKLTVEDLEEASDALLSEASEASEAEQEGEQPVTKHDRTS
jgi:transcriptional regulator with XRE-family HTH domain